MADFPTSCSKCGAAIYAQWWSSAENAYRCRACGTLNPGLGPELAPRRPVSRVLVGFLVLVWGVLVLGGLFLMQMLSPSDFESSEAGIYRFLFGVVFGVPWLVVLVVTAVATWRLRRGG